MTTITKTEVGSNQITDATATRRLLNTVIPANFHKLVLKSTFQGHHQHVDSSASVKVYLGDSSIPIFEGADSVFTDFNLGFTQEFVGLAEGETFRVLAVYKTNNVLNDHRFKLDLTAEVYSEE